MGRIEIISINLAPSPASPFLIEKGIDQLHIRFSHPNKGDKDLQALPTDLKPVDPLPSTVDSLPRGRRGRLICWTHRLSASP